MAWLGGTARRGGPEFLTPNLLSSSQTAGLQDPAGATLPPRPRPSVHRPSTARPRRAQHEASPHRGERWTSALHSALTTSLFPTNTGAGCGTRAWRGGCRPRLRLPGRTEHELGGGAGSARIRAPSSPVPLRARNPARPPHTLGAPAENGWLLRFGCARDQERGGRTRCK